MEAGYFEQNQAEALNLEKTVIDTLFEAVPIGPKRKCARCWEVLLQQ